MLGLLNISEAASIALHLCVWLAQDTESFRATREASRELGFSPHHLAKIVQQLSRCGLLETERGPAGGARLARPTDQITLLAIYEAAGGVPEPKGCLLRPEVCGGTRCALGKLMAHENRKLLNLLKSTTLKAIVRSLEKDTAKQRKRKGVTA